MFTKSSRGNMKDRMSAPGHVALLAFGLMMAFALVSMPVVASVADGAVSDSDAKCLKCHSKKLKKSLEDGQILSLHVPVAEFAESVHSTVGCTSCHQGIADRKHPKTKVAISSERAYSVEMNQVCGDCHETKIKQYEGSIHASLVADGNHTAPVCTDCHSAHAVKAMAMYEPVTGQSCKTCHGEIFEAYAQSVHGEARTNGNVIRASHIQAPICADCHRAHETTAVAAGELVQSTCLSCHDEASLAHEQWLPNAGHHLEMVSCAACHAPMAERRKLVRQTSQEGKATDVTLRGRMEVSTGADAHRLAVKTSAVRECNSCHENGSGAFQNVTVSISRPDGRKQRYEADSEILTSAVSVDAVRGFYAAGGTRIKLLDGLLILGIIGGLAIPVGHATIGKILKNKL
jgi:hypothetical protein